MKMNLHLTRVFYEVARHRSFSRAAGFLCVSQPAASKAVRELESQLKLPLIERGVGGTKGARGVRLTESGQALFEHARGIFALEHAAIDDLRARVGLRQGRLIIGASTTVAGYWLPPYVAQFERRFPLIELHIVVGNTQAINQGLVDCRMDLALVEGQVNDSSVESRLWRSDLLLIIAQAQSPLVREIQREVSELNNYTWLVRESGSGTGEVTHRLLQEHGLEPKKLVEFGSNEGIARSVADGAGIAMLPLVVVQDLIALGRVKAIRLTQMTSFERPLFLLERKERPMSPAAQAFWALLQQPLPAM